MAPSTTSASKSVAVATADTKPFRFTSLPRELRDDVYDRVLSFGKAIRMRAATKARGDKAVSIKTGILSVDKATNREALEAVCRNNTIHIDLDEVCLAHKQTGYRKASAYRAWLLTLPYHTISVRVDSMWLHGDACCLLHFLQTIIDAAASREGSRKLKIDIHAMRSEFPTSLIPTLRALGKTVQFTGVGHFNFPIVSATGPYPAISTVVEYTHRPVSQVFDIVANIPNSDLVTGPDLLDYPQIRCLPKGHRFVVGAVARVLSIYYKNYPDAAGEEVWADFEHTPGELDTVTRAILRREMQARCNYDD
ncbi:hypothetical protein LTR10_000163 [Elasticomyces elasticus]|nr:hypothetical protein LTR10_000163 [Elasticomyces elasticus]KAK4980579.1 hypothetical protein LTR42_000887 [Elasticomyces elasticus]